MTKKDYVDKPIYRDRVKPLVEVPSKRRSSKSNLIRSLFKPWFPLRIRKHPPFGTPILSQCIPTHAGSLGRVKRQVAILSEDPACTSSHCGYKNTLGNDTYTRSPPGSFLHLASSSGNSDVVFRARFPRRLGRP
jgi:hypothetical protein